MRRKQTTLIVTSIMIFSLLTMSQLPAIQSVENVHPEDANQGPPPVTDTEYHKYDFSKSISGEKFSNQ